ncbi:MAG: membrane dipeptidase [Acetobacteraceae bacterium]
MMYIDGLECSLFDRQIFEELRAGELTCVTCTLAFWENAGETMERIAHWRDLERENTDLILLARSPADIERADASGRTAILLGSQNTSPLEDRLRFVELFYDLGVRIMQLTYNNQNAYGGSCYEPADSGLSRAGKQLIREMNRVGMMIDLSHVGNRTAQDVITQSERPVAITHANAYSLFAHRRNKPDEVLQALARAGGMLGLATYRNICGEWVASIDKWCEMVARTVEVVGADHLGIGTDLSRKSGEAELSWMRHGRWTREADYGAGSVDRSGKALPPEWFRSTLDFPRIADGLERQGFSEAEVANIMGANWLRFYQRAMKE